MALPLAVKEPNRVLAHGCYLNFQWIVSHNTMGFRCGYVRVPSGHPWHGKKWREIDADVHGGLTYSEPDYDDDSWWVGFDCAHCMDLPDPALPWENQHVPAMVDFINKMRDGSFAGDKPEVRGQNYVETECLNLCEQAAKAIGTKLLN